MAELRAIFALTGPDVTTDKVEVRSGAVFTIGRAPENNLQLNNGRVSRHHADITERDGQFFIEDLESSNGTYVNDQRIEAKKPYPLAPGNILRLGPFTLTFERVETATPAVPATPAILQQQPTPERRDEPLPSTGPLSQPPVPSAATPTKGPEPTLPPLIPVAPPQSNGEAHLADLVSLSPPMALAPSTNGHRKIGPYVPLEGVPSDASRYLDYLPGVFSDSEFLKKYLLIPESILAPLDWSVDSLEQYYNPLLTTPDWLQWIASWFDVLIHPSVPVERQRAVVKELGTLFFQRGTRKGMERLLELYFGVKPQIDEPDSPPATFKVKLALGKEDTPLMRALADRIISTYKPAHTNYTLEVN